MSTDIRQTMSSDMQTKMLANDFKANCVAITELGKYLANEPDTLIAVLDVVAKWVFVKMWDTSNT
jgi:hypothetical protein